LFSIQGLGMNQPAPRTLATLSIPGSPHPSKSIAIQAGAAVFLLGRNGTGKSALMHRLYGSVGNNVVYLPGSRPSYFENESLSITPASRRTLDANFRGWDSSPDTRWRQISGTTRNDKAIHDLQSAESQYSIDAANEIKRDGPSSPAIARLQSNSSPLDRINALLSQANLPIRTIFSDGELKVERQGSIYSIARSSDGERAALVFAAEVVSAKDNTIFLVDEPELHLHPSIAIPLLSALMAERPNCAFIICTHELELAVSSESAILVLVRGCTWQNANVIAWDVDILENADQIPEELRIDLVGSRRKILFVEGETDSLDQPIYELLFPEVSIKAKSGCREVRRAVSGLRATQPLHRVSAFGLVDNDGMLPERISELESEGVFPLPFFSVESVYYCADVVSAVAEQQSQTLGIPVASLTSDAKTMSLAAVNVAGIIEHLAVRVAEQQTRETVIANIPDRQSIQSNQSIQITVASKYPAQLAALKALVLASDLDGIIAKYPVRESGVLSALARGLRFRDRADFERAALTRIGADTDLQRKLKLRMGKLALELS
jgi:energy-coupling factor transporter ATP-binding protein EcfA2